MNSCVATRVLAATVVIVAGVAAPLAQTPGPSLTGRVIDDTGRVLPGVTVEVASPDAPPRKRVVTDERGEFAITGLPDGTYDVRFSEINFADAHRRGVVVRGSTPTPALQVTLHLSLAAEVVVTAPTSFRNLADLDHPEENLVGVAGAASEGAVTAARIAARPIMRTGEILEAVPGVIISQHSGEGKANQYYLRGFNLDHGTDFATTVAGMPVNLPTHGHGQGYADLNFLIPELVSGVQFRKGPYDAESGDFSAAGTANVNYVNALDHAVLNLSTGEEGWNRVLAAASPRLGRGHLLAALELAHNDGPWVHPDAYQRFNGVVRYSERRARDAFSLTGLAYRGTWNSTDQVPERAIETGVLSRFDAIDPTAGGRTARYSLIGDYQHESDQALTRATVYASWYRLNLFSNFTYALDDPEHGDQFEQADRRWVTGSRVTHTRQSHWGDRLLEHTVGLQVRHDRIPSVGLYHTEARTRLSTIREDAVGETAVGAFAETFIRWTPWLRTTAGLRVDRYAFDVRSDDPVNSGRTSASTVGPKASVVLGPWRQTEFYVNAGRGFHSNDARGTTIARDPATGDQVTPVTPLVPATGAEIGFRSVAIPRAQTTVALWRLDLASELLFVGDAGTTEAGRPSRRYGLEWSTYVRLSRHLTADGDLAWSHAAFTDHDPAGSAIPGAARVVASAGLSAESIAGAFGSVRLRHFGPRPLVEDGRVSSRGTRLVNAQLGYHLRPRVHVVLDVFNLFDAAVSDIDYFYASRLPGEPAGGVEDVHTHPALPRNVRVSVKMDF